MSASVAVIAIGRNEGERLIGCLDALGQSTVKPGRIIYVDSGSTDGSIEVAKARGAEVVLLDTRIPFTAARARNAGVEALKDQGLPDFLQFIDGDCALDPAWLKTALSFMQKTPDAIVVCGRRREKFPESSVYNRLCDVEWDTPIGQARACGGDALMRSAAFEAVDGFDPTLIAGEEPDLCVRMRQNGGHVWRIDAEMTLHDAAITRFGQFWKRMRRGGHAFAEGAARHGHLRERHGIKGRNSAVFWGLVLPCILLLLTLMWTPWALLAVVIYPIQMTRLALKGGGSGFAWKRGVLLVVGKFAEGLGVLEYYRNRLRKGPAELIEYK